MKHCCVVIGFVMFAAGCGTTGQNGQAVRPMSATESPKDVESAMGAVVGSVTGQPVEREDLLKLGEQIRDDKDAQSAVGSITGAVGDAATAGKYCPVDGERYSAQFTECPTHKALLKNIEE